MKRIRLGNDITIHWRLVTFSDVAGRDVTLYIVTPYGRFKASDFTITEDTLVYTFRGKDQCHVGSHTLTAVIDEGRPGMMTIDACNAFTLVSNCVQEHDGHQDIDLQSNLTLRLGVDESLISVFRQTLADFEDLRKTVTSGVDTMQDGLRLIKPAVENWIRNNLTQWTESIIMVLPEYGHQPNLDPDAFCHIVDAFHLTEKAGYPMPCLFKREKSDPLAFGILTFSVSENGQSQRLDIHTMSAISSSDMEKDIIKWSPGGLGYVTLSYLFDTQFKTLITLGETKQFIDDFAERIKKLETVVFNAEQNT